jgi:ribose transport system substrate-binding protein
MKTTVRRRLVPMAAVSMAAIGCLAACSTASGSGSSAASASGSSAASASGSAAAAIAPATVAASGCGSLPGALPPSPDGSLSTLSPALQKAYLGSTDPVVKSAWADSQPVKGPWKIGYTGFPADDPIDDEYLAEFQKDFNEAKAAGLVTGSLDVELLPDPTSMTPAGQVQLYQTMVRNGDNGIILQALSAPAMTSVVTAAGKQGIVTSSFNPIDSPYAISTQVSFYQDAGNAAAAVLKQLGGKGNVLIVRGIPGAAPDTDGYAGIQAALKECPGVTVVGSVTAQFSDATAKSAVETFLASHPGQIDAVLTTGGAATGVINAFQQTGRTIPLVTGNGATAGFFTYWNEHKGSYSPAATVGSPSQQADAVWDSLIRTLAGNDPRVNVIDPPSVLVNSGNFSSFVQAGQSDTSTNIVPAVASAPYLTTAYLDQFYAKPGQPG